MCTSDVGREASGGLAEAICILKHLIFQLCYWPDLALVGKEDWEIDRSYLRGISGTCKYIARLFEEALCCANSVGQMILFACSVLVYFLSNSVLFSSIFIVIVWVSLLLGKEMPTSCSALEIDVSPCAPVSCVLGKVTCSEQKRTASGITFECKEWWLEIMIAKLMCCSEFCDAVTV